MLKKLSTIPAIETVLMKLIMKQKQFIYQIARLEYRIYKGLSKWNELEILISTEERNIKSLIAAIKAAGEGSVAEKLLIWKAKAEHKLFKLNLRKNKIDIPRLILNQSKLKQLKKALISLETDIKEIISQKESFYPVIKIENVSETNYKDLFAGRKMQKDIEKENLLTKSIAEFLKANLKMAS